MDQDNCMQTDVSMLYSGNFGGYLPPQKKLPYRIDHSQRKKDDSVEKYFWWVKKEILIINALFKVQGVTFFVGAKSMRKLQAIDKEIQGLVSFYGTGKGTLAIGWIIQDDWDLVKPFSNIQHF